jgi:hypothetical protein
MIKNREVIIQASVVLASLLLGGVIGSAMTGGRSSSVSAIKTAAEPVTAKSVAKPAERPFTTLVPTASSTDVAAAPATRKTLDQIMKGRISSNRTKELEEFAQNIAPSDIGAALKELHKMPEGTARSLAEKLLIARWAETDPDGAVKFASENHDFDFIASDVFQQLAADDMQGALARAQALSDPNARYQALRGVLSYMADQDPLGALRLAATLGNFPNNESLSQVIYRQWSQIDPQAAAAAASMDQSAGQGWRSPVSQVLRNWAGQDPLSALAWANSVADAGTQARDIAQIIREWGRDDVAAAGAYVNNLPAGSNRDAAAAALAYSLAGSDPAAAIPWAQSISDNGQREAAIQRLAREIMFRNPANGAAILQAAGIPQNMIPTMPPPGQGGGRRGR